MIQLSDHFTCERLLRFTFPSIVMLIFTSIYGVVDGFFVSNFVGKTPFAAVNLIMPYLMILGCVGFMFGSGGSALISKTMGEGQDGRANEIFSLLIYVSAACGVALAVLGTLFLRPMASLMGAEGQLLEDCVVYGTINLLGLPFYILQFEFQCLFATAEKPRLGLYVTVAAGVTNMALDALFVMGFGWGVWGAALATGLAQVTSTSVFLGYFLTHRERLRIQRFRLGLGAYRRIVPLGLSEGLNELSNGLVIFLFNHTILRFIGEQALPAYTIISYVNTLVLMTMTGTAQGMQPLVSFSLGAGRRRDCHRLLKYGLAAAALFAGLSFALGELGAPLIVGAFLKRSSPIFAYSVSALRLYGWSFLVVGFNVVFAAFFTAVERPVPAFAISLSRSLVLLAASLLAMAVLFGDRGIWLSTFVSELGCLCITAVCAAVYFRRRDWETETEAPISD